MRSKQDKVEDGITSVGIGALGAGIIYAFIRPFLKRRKETGASEGEGGEDAPVPTPTGPEPHESTYADVPGEIPSDSGVPQIIIPEAIEVPSIIPAPAEDSGVSVTDSNYSDLLEKAAGYRARIQELKDMRDAGEITQSEYDLRSRVYREKNQEISRAIRRYQNG